MVPNRFISYLKVNRASIVSRKKLAFYLFRFQIRISYKFRDAVGYLMDNVEFGYLVSNGEEKGSRGKQLYKILEENRRNPKLNRKQVLSLSEPSLIENYVLQHLCRYKRRLKMILLMHLLESNLFYGESHLFDRCIV